MKKTTFKNRRADNICRISRIGKKDIPRVRSLLVSTWMKTYGVSRKDAGRANSLELIRSQLKDPKFLFLAARLPSGRLVGVSTFVDEGRGLVTCGRLYVRHSYHGKGIGSLLLKTSLGKFPDARRVRLRVASSNSTGMAFYLKRGFRRIRVSREDCGCGKISVLVMQKVFR